MDPDADWLIDDDNTTTESNAGAVETSASSDGDRPVPIIPTGPPVPNPYAHINDKVFCGQCYQPPNKNSVCLFINRHKVQSYQLWFNLEVPCKKREYTHWARNKHLQYKYLNEYLEIYYNDYVDFMDKRRKGMNRDVPRPYEWSERALKLYAKDERLSGNDVAYWYTTKNQVKPMYSIFHAVHSKDYYDRQYKSILC